MRSTFRSLAEMYVVWSVVGHAINWKTFLYGLFCAAIGAVAMRMYDEWFRRPK